MHKESSWLNAENLRFSNVVIPEVGTTNLINHTNTIMGIETVLSSFIRRPDLTNPHRSSSGDLSQLRIDHPDLGKTNQLDLVSITAHLLKTTGSSWSDTYHKFSIKHVPANATHLDLTFSVQEARFVEFTVAPNCATNDYITERK